MGPPGPPGPGPMDGGLQDAEAGTQADADSVGPDAGIGLSGRVYDSTGLSVPRGRVVLIPASRVEQLASTPIDLTLAGAAAAGAANDEPIEDVLASDATLPTVNVDSEGRYRFDSIPDGSFFVVYAPDAADDAHLPGGQMARAPVSAASLRGAVVDLKVSAAPSASASYVGSSACLGCHGRQSSLASAHALTLRVPGVSAGLQDDSSAPRIDEALSAFQAGETLYFFDCDPARTDAPTCQIALSPPADASSVRLQITLGVEASVSADAVGHYFVELASGGVTLREPVALTLGGAGTAQQMVVRAALSGGGVSHFILPFTYQLGGDDQRPAERDQRWIAYRVGDWLDLATGMLHAPANEQAFERQCAGCHATGFVGRGDVTAGFQGAAAEDPQGIYDLDGDKRKELVAVGCEACHGPGSEHLERSPRGQRIVSPRLLTPERQNLICGQCHARVFGTHDELAPLDTSLHMPRAGIARSAYLARHVSRHDTGAGVLFPSGDPRVGFSQYGDLLRSRKYRNPSLLVVCSDCHDPHRSAGYPEDLRDPGGNATCGGCHAAMANDVLAHAAAKVGYAHDQGVDRSALTCTACHLVRTGASGARTLGLLDTSNPQAPVQFFQGDRATHRFVFEDRARIPEQPVAATLACGSCHGVLFITP